jgi:hypothetical protein
MRRSRAMMPFEYQIVVQWSDCNERYEAYSPTLVRFSRMFVPDFPRTAYGDSPSTATENAIVQANKLLKLVKNLALLPPPPDVGKTDPVNYAKERVGGVKNLG